MTRARHRAIAGAGLLVLLAGCDRPAWLTRADPLPALPGWAQPLAGRPLDEAFALAPAEACLGNTEQISDRYETGVKLMGWGWDAVGAGPTARVLITTPDRRIVGAGEAGLARQDVPQALPQVTSAETGWWALAAQASGAVEAWGVMADGRACPLGRIDL